MHFGATFTIDANTLRWSRLLAPKKLFSRQNRVSVLHSLVRCLSPRYSRLPHHTLVFGSCPGSGNSQTIMFPSSEAEDAPDFFRSYTKISDWSKSFVLREFGLSEAFVWCVLQFCQAADRKPVSWRRRSEETVILTLRANMSHFPNFSATQPFVCWIKMTVCLSLDICTLFSPFQMWLLRMFRRRVKRII